LIGLEVGDTLVHRTRGYFRLGDRLRVVGFTENNTYCFAVIDVPGYNFRYTIPLPLNEEEWDVDYTAGPSSPGYIKEEDGTMMRTRNMERAWSKPVIGVYFEDHWQTSVHFRRRWQATLFHMLLNSSYSDHAGTRDN